MPTAVGVTGVRGFDASHQPAMRGVGRVRRPQRCSASRSPRSRRRHRRAARSAASDRSSSTASSSPTSSSSEDGFVTVAGGYGGEPWVPQAIPRRPCRTAFRAAVVRPRALRGRRSGVGLARRPAAASRSSSGRTRSSSPATTPSALGRHLPGVDLQHRRGLPARDDVRVRPVGALPATATIGIEDILGEHATAVLGAATRHRAGSRRARSVSTTRVRRFDPATLGYSATVAPAPFRARTPTTPCTSPTIPSPSRSPSRRPSPSTACARRPSPATISVH